jgi:hypothetical protein
VLSRDDDDIGSLWVPSDGTSDSLTTILRLAGVMIVSLSSPRRFRARSLLQLGERCTGSRYQGLLGTLT